MVLTFQSDDADLQNPQWLMPLASLMTISKKLGYDDAQGSELRTVNFMAYELAHLCESKSEEEKLQLFNEFFFEIKKFKLASSPFLLNSILEERTGCGIALALLYMHLAQGLGLAMDLVHWPLHSILKFSLANRTCYVDLELKGKVLSEEEMLLMINKHKDQVRTLTLKDAVLQYLSYIALNYRQNEDLGRLHGCLCLILSLEPECTRVLAERAFLRKELGLCKEALSDLKRYFAFTEIEKAPPEIMACYEYVRGEALR